MKRRKFLTLASGSIVGLAGCAGEFQQGENPVREEEATPDTTDIDTEETTPTRLGLTDVEFDGREIVVTVSDSRDVTDRVEIQSETGQGKTIQVSGTKARAEIIDPRRASRADIRPIGPGTVTVQLYDEAGEVIDEATVEYNPDLTLNVQPAAESVYQQAEDPRASALFTFSNSGIGPTYLRSFEIRDGENTMPLTELDDYGNKETTFVRLTTVTGLDSEEFDPVGIGEDNEDLFLPQSAPLSFGGDGIFSHVGPEPESAESFTQVFEVIAETELDREYVFEVTVEFSGGITEASIETVSDATVYRFEEFEVSAEQIDSP